MLCTFCVTTECVCENNEGVVGLDCAEIPEIICPKKCYFHDIHNPAKDGLAHCVDYQVNERADVDQSVEGTSPLYQAVSKGKLDIVRLLVDNTIKNASLQLTSEENCTECDRDGDSPLHEAVIKGFDEITQFLISRGADVKAKNGLHDNSQPIHEACINGRSNALRLLINGGADINAKDKLNSTGLIFAAAHGHAEIVRLAVDRGADVNIRNSAGDTALNQATMGAFDGSIEIQYFLTSVGATETGSCTCENGVAFDQVACPVSYEDYCASCTEKLECRSCGSMNLGTVAEDGFLECIGHRIELGDGVNDLYGNAPLNLHGSTPLHLAVTGKYRFEIAPRYKSIVEILVNDYQANIDSEDADGDTPIQKAVQEEDADMVKLLISLGANVNLHVGFGEGVSTLELAGNATEIGLILSSAGATETGICPCSNGGGIFGVSCPVVDNDFGNATIITDHCDSCDPGYELIDIKCSLPPSCDDHVCYDESICIIENNEATHSC